MAATQGPVFLSPNRTLQLTYEGEFYEVLIAKAQLSAIADKGGIPSSTDTVKQL